MLVSRLKSIISNHISLNKYVFVPQHIIGDNVMLAQPLCRDYHRDKGAQ